MFWTGVAVGFVSTLGVSFVASMLLMRRFTQDRE